jgi:hypothetical protein
MHTIRPSVIAESSTYGWSSVINFIIVNVYSIKLYHPKQSSKKKSSKSNSLIHGYRPEPTSQIYVITTVPK